ncbi:unnamed protein product [Alternaria alternata]
MMRISGPRARFALLALVVFALCSFVLVGPYKVTPSHLAPTSVEKKLGRTSEAVLTGHAIAPKLENATAKLTSKRRAELGRAAWKVLHTTFARFPESPTDEEQEALRSYVHLFQRLYPWYVLHRVAHTKVMRKLTGIAAGNAQSTSGKYSQSILLKYRRGQQPPCGVATYTISSTRGWASPSSVVKI